MKKVFFNLAFLALSSVAFASSPDAIPGNSETKTKSFSHEYWVIAKLNATTYQLSTPAPEEDCSGGPDPCYITTATDHTNNLQISVSELNNPSQTTIEVTQDSL